MSQSIQTKAIPPSSFPKFPLNLRVPDLRVRTFFKAGSMSRTRAKAVAAAGLESLDAMGLLNHAVLSHVFTHAAQRFAIFTQPDQSGPGIYCEIDFADGIPDKTVFPIARHRAGEPPADVLQSEDIRDVLI